jgi:RNA polymerase sigma-70 factor (ECF subfamily)
LQHLSALQRAALILRDVPGFSAAEVAGQLDTSTAAVNSALQRARQAIASTAPTQQTVLRDLGDAAVNDILTRWIDAWQAATSTRSSRCSPTRALLDAAAARVVPRPGRDPRLHALRPAAKALAVPVHQGQRPGRVRHLPVGRRRRGVHSGGLDVLTLLDGRVAEIVAFLNADLTRFGLPERVRPQTGPELGDRCPGCGHKVVRGPTA